MLVTGATGFLGRHLVARLCELDYDVEILARASSDLSPLKNFPIRIRTGEVTQTLPMLEAVEGKDIVFHLAGQIAYKKSQRPGMEKVNVQGTRNVIDACVTHSTAKVLHLSSVVTIGASATAKSLNESSQYNMGRYNLGYFETKRKAEAIALDAVKEHELPVYILNPSTIYGPGDATKGSRSTQIKVARGRFRFFTPGGVNVVHVADVVDCIFKVLERGQAGRRYICAGENMKIRDLFNTIASEAGVAAPSIGLPRWFLKGLGRWGDLMTSFGKETSLSSETAVTSTMYHWYNNERARQELGFAPRPAEDAIRDSVHWMREQSLI